MYIQPPAPPAAEEFALPRGYSGNAFRRQPTEEEPPEPAAPSPAPDAAAENAPEAAESPLCDTTSAQGQTEAETAPVMGHTEKPAKGFLGRLPFLSSLLPPPRSAGSRGGVLPEWLLIGAVILLFLAEDEGGDILPLLLLLLLWD